MKARVKTTGEIVDVYESCNEDFPWTDEMGDEIWKTEELIFLETTDNIPDYWTRLEHQYAGMAMQGLMSYIAQVTPTKGRSYCDEIVDLSVAVAHALVEKMKEERK